MFQIRAGFIRQSARLSSMLSVSWRQVEPTHAVWRIGNEPEPNEHENGNSKWSEESPEGVDNGRKHGTPIFVM